MGARIDSDTDSLPIDIMRGVPAHLKTRVDVWEVPGVDGYGAQTLGQGDAEFELMTVNYCADNTEANGVIASAEGMQGAMCLVHDDFGDDYDNVLVTHVDTNGSKKPMQWQDNANAVRVELHWRCVTTQAQS